ncbi:MAG: hypothetical protein HRU18_11170 [Pseudoalteromonas sp.]|uniref:hypothetical protein n=1 Tax=Pseudoalteromonas sp. TaxID=53249 RepID=UPI001D5D333B|nr:hypothetical protein [Pseudoalteromonas sp.]NRA78760.1 hypothetical protein [Pseudoalteromonas sp.]
MKFIEIKDKHGSVIVNLSEVLLIGQSNEASSIHAVFNSSTECNGIDIKCDFFFETPEEAKKVMDDIYELIVQKTDY